MRADVPVYMLVGMASCSRARFASVVHTPRVRNTDTHARACAIATPTATTPLGTTCHAPCKTSRQPSAFRVPNKTGAGSTVELTAEMYEEAAAHSHGVMANNMAVSFGGTAVAFDGSLVRIIHIQR